MEKRLLSVKDALLSYGGGVNSTALAVWIYGNDRPLFDSMNIVFADTGNEMPETYEFITQHFIPWLESKGQRLVIVGRRDSLEEYCLTNKVLPMRQWRWCTDKWKIRVINKWANANMGKPRDYLIAIASDEAARANENPIEFIKNHFPLVDNGITRILCKEIITAVGLPVPPKSGCHFCPLAPWSHFDKLKHEHPDLYARTLAMEDNAKDGYTLKGTPVKHATAETQISMNEDEEECSSGYCFV